MDPLPQDHNLLPESLLGSQVSPYRRAEKKSRNIEKNTKICPSMLKETKLYLHKKRNEPVYRLVLVRRKSIFQNAKKIKKIKH